MGKPVLTILMPAFNAAAYIGEAIRSVLMQSFTDFELLIVDNGSTDGTVPAILQWKDPRIRIISEPLKGIANALNKCLSEATGAFIARFDADDICLPGRLEKQLNFLQANPDYVMVGSDAEYIDENGEHLFYFHCIGHTHEQIMHKLYHACPFIHSAVMYRRKAVLEAGSYSIHTHNFEDYLLWTRLPVYGRYHNIPEALVKIRFNAASVTIDEKWRGSRFRRLKKKIIRQGFATEENGKELLRILQRQDEEKFKKASYYALCGKKFLLNNHQPGKARAQFASSIRYYPLRFDNYVFYLLSFFPGSFINWLHKRTG